MNDWVWFILLCPFFPPALKSQLWKQFVCSDQNQWSRRGREGLPVRLAEGVCCWWRPGRGVAVRKWKALRLVVARQMARQVWATGQTAGPPVPQCLGGRGALTGLGSAEGLLTLLREKLESFRGYMFNMKAPFGQTCFGLVFAHQPFIFISASFTRTALLWITLGQAQNRNYFACASVWGGAFF